jgi:hypothetical protein
MHFSRGYDRWWRQDVILTVGPKTFTRQTCVTELGCPNFKAAQNLSHALASIGVDSTKALAKTTPTDLLRLEGVGERTVFVALCVLDATTTGETAQRWLHSDETKPDTIKPPKPKVPQTAKEKTRARHTRPGGMPAKTNGKG